MSATNSSMREANMPDGTKLYCIKKTEAMVLDSHVEGYFKHGIQLKEDDVIFDVGANIGMFGVRACQQFEKVQIYAFEPIPDIHEVLAANAEKFGKGRFHALKCGVSDSPGKATFTYYPNSPALSSAHSEMWDKDPNMFLNAVKGSIAEDAPKGLKWVRFLPNFIIKMIATHLKSGAKQFDCQLRTLSEIVAENNIQKIDLLKIDCEGAELLVLNGIADSDWPKIQQVVVEVHNADGRLEIVQNLLRKHGFSKIELDREKALEKTNLFNIYATR